MNELHEVLIAQARMDERLKAVIERMDDREADREERDKALRESIHAAVHSAVTGSVGAALQPLTRRVEQLEVDSTKAAAVQKKVVYATGGAVTALGALGWLWDHAQEITKFLVPLFVVMLLAGCAAEAPPEFYGDLPRWCPEERPVYVLVDSDMSEECIEGTLGGLSFWSSAGVSYLQPLMIAGDSPAFTKPPPRSIIVTEGLLLDPSQLGVAHWTTLTPECLLFATVTLASCRTHTVAHELGHTLGLPHIDDSGNVMFPYASETEEGPWGLTTEQLEHVL